jgi:hypothetical protein
MALKKVLQGGLRRNVTHILTKNLHFLIANFKNFSFKKLGLVRIRIQLIGSIDKASILRQNFENCPSTYVHCKCTVLYVHCTLDAYIYDVPCGVDVPVVCSAVSTA